MPSLPEEVWGFDARAIIAVIVILCAIILIILTMILGSEYFDAILAFCGAMVISVVSYYFGARNSEARHQNSSGG